MDTIITIGVFVGGGILAIAPLYWHHRVTQTREEK